MTRLCVAAFLFGVGCADSHTGAADGGPDAACMGVVAPPPAATCDATGVARCRAWASSMSPAAVARCTTDIHPLGTCVAASTCEAGNCRCGASGACAAGEACIADGTNFRCLHCVP